MMNLRLYFFTVIFSCSFVGIAFAQQPAQYSMYMLNPYHYNTAFGGLDESLSATAVFRKQWLGLNGTPLSFNFNAHLPLEYLSSGVGIAVEQDMRGVGGFAYSNTHLRASYNYILDLGDAGYLSMGGAFRFMQKQVDGTSFRAPDGSYDSDANLFDHEDGLLPFARMSGNAMSADAAIYYKHPSFEVGLSAINLTEPILSLDANQEPHEKLVRNYILTSRYNWYINNEMLLQPSFLVKTDFNKIQAELGAIFKYQDNFFGGLAFRGYSRNTSDAVVLLAGMQINENFMLAYSYDLTISGLRNVSSGSHEVVLNYNLRKKLGKEIPAKVIYNPRFL